MQPPVAKTVPLDVPASMKPQPGAILGDRYVLESPIQQGAAGEVWKARHAHLGKLFAIKILKSEHLDGEDDWATKRMLREAKLVSEIEHVGVVDVIDYGQWGGRPYIVMELLVGRTLLEALRDSGAMPWSRARSLLAQMIESLAAAHRVGVIHRDIKPANLVLLDGDTKVKVIDFGIAGAPRRTRITTAGEVLGTPHFMSPEQTRTMDLTPASDVYSLGCVAYTMLTGRPPFVGELGAIVRQHIKAPVPKLAGRVGADVPKSVCTVVERCLAKRPEDRYASMEELYAALMGRPMGLEASVPWTTRIRAYAVRASRTSRGVVAVAIAGTLVALGLAGTGLAMWRRGGTEVRSTPLAPMHRTLPAAVVESAPPQQPESSSRPEPELPVERAKPKPRPSVSPPDPPERGRGKPVRSKPAAPASDSPAEPVAEPTPPEPVLPPEPAEPAEEDVPADPPPDRVEKVGGLKNPFDGL